jgi:hypothetical protein
LSALDAEAAAEGDAANDHDSGGPENKQQSRHDRQPPKVISPSDPQSAWTAKANKRVQFGYGLNYLIDIENAVIIDVEATPARTYDEVVATQTMLDRAQERFDLKPKRLAADTAYGTGKFLGWLVKTRKSSRIFRSGIRAIGRTAFSRAQTFAGTRSAASMYVRTASCCRPVAPCTMGARCAIVRRSKTATDVRSERSAAPRPRRARCHAISMKMLATSLGRR